MTLAKFIRKNQQEIDRVIRAVCPGAPNDANDRELWVLNEESLYRWAQSVGVEQCQK